MGENHFAALPVALYGAVLLLAAIAYSTLTRTLISHTAKIPPLRTLLGGILKESYRY